MSECIELNWVDKLINELKDLHPDIPDLDDPNLKDMLELDFCNVISDDEVGFASRIFSFYKSEIEKSSRKNPSLKSGDTNTLLLDGITRSIELAVNFEIERVKTHNQNVSQTLSNNLVKAQILETQSNTMLGIERLKFNIYESCTRFEIDKKQLNHNIDMDTKRFDFDTDLAKKRFCLEEMMSYAQVEGMKADYTLKKTQAISFVFNQRTKLVDVLFNTLIVGVTQELMHILEEPNEMLGGLSPKDKFESAWMEDMPFLNEINDIKWEGICKPKKCLCELCEEE